jgi:hypothetical protein
VGLSTLERIGEMSMISDRPPIATSGNGALSILTQDTLHAVYRAGNVLEQYDPARGQLTGPTPFSYIAGTLPILHSEQIAANILVGNFGPEVALLCEQSNREGAYTLAASDSLPAQAVMFAAAQEPLIGEELFAIPAYLNAKPVFAASLRTQDVLRWVIMAVLVGGALFKLVSIFLGGNIQ